MARHNHTIWCDGCGAEIQWTPVVAQNHDYCCKDCLDGYECECAALMTWVEDMDREAPANLNPLERWSRPI